MHSLKIHILQYVYRLFLYCQKLWKICMKSNWNHLCTWRTTEINVFVGGPEICRKYVDWLNTSVVFRRFERKISEGFSHGKTIYVHQNLQTTVVFWIFRFHQNLQAFEGTTHSWATKFSFSECSFPVVRLMFRLRVLLFILVRVRVPLRSLVVTTIIKRYLWFVFAGVSWTTEIHIAVQQCGLKVVQTASPHVLYG